MGQWEERRRVEECGPIFKIGCIKFSKFRFCLGNICLNSVALLCGFDVCDWDWCAVYDNNVHFSIV